MPRYLVVEQSRCRRLPLPDDLLVVGGPQLAEWCEEHDAAWPPDERSCRTIRAMRAGTLLYRVRIRWWHPGAWLALAREVREARAARRG